MPNGRTVIKNRTKKQMEKELYNIELDEYAEEIRNDLRDYNITYSMLYNLIKDEIAENRIAMSESSMKNMLCKDSAGYNVITRLRLIFIIRKNKKFERLIKAINIERERIKKERKNRKLELIKILNDKDVKFGREYSKIEKLIHRSLNVNPSQQIRYQEKVSGIFRDRRN